MSPKFAVPRFAFFQTLFVVPKLYIPVVAGFIFCSNSTLKLIVSLATPSPTVIFPSNDRFPVTSKLSLTFTLLVILVSVVAGLILISPAIVLILLSLIAKLATSITLPSISVLDPLSITNPAKLSASAELISSVVVPVSKSTKKLLPTLKLP